MASDQFCLRWNNFQVNITSALENLKSDEELVDVTLTCDGQNVKAHKVILSACSPYFRAVFKENPCQHPVVILKDVKFEDVTALLNFMYQGEVYITQDRLAPFLHTAELLQIRGLAGATNPFKETPSTQSHPTVQQPPPLKLRKTAPQSWGHTRHVTPSIPAPTNSSPMHNVGKPSMTHPYQLSKSPTLSPSRKDIQLASSREKAKDISSVREIESDFASRSFSPSGLSVLGQQSSSYHTTSDQPYPPYVSDQGPLSTLASPASVVQLNDGSSPQPSSLPYSDISASDRASSQSTSPQPAAKKHKAFPRRLSSSHTTTEPSVPSPAESDPKSQAQLMEEVDEVDIPMKQEQIDEIGQDEDLSQEGSTPVGQVNLESGDVEEMGLYSQSASNLEIQPLEQDLKDESSHGDEMSEQVPQGRMMPALVDVQTHILPQTDGLSITPKQEMSTGEVLVLQPWNENSNISFPLANWDPERPVSDNSAFPVTENSQVSCAKSRNTAPSVMQPQQTLSFGTDVHSFSSSSYSSRQYRRLLYQRRKHIWNSRRPVQCPNCHKTISMAYNLKSHLTTCVKRHGMLYKK